jgi:pantothenate kinase
MDVGKLAEDITRRASAAPRYLIAIAGPPAAGKSTLAAALCQRLTDSGEQAKLISMDGFHLDNEILISRGLLARKGAPQTFDADAFVRLIEALRSAENNVAVPGFDRLQDRVVEAADIISPDDRILVIEGNYLLLDHGSWVAAHRHWDETIFINPGIQELERRLMKRWLDLGMSEAQASEKAMGNDIPNARLVIEHSITADRIE